MKTLVHVWLQKYHFSEVGGFWGLGDFLRGAWYFAHYSTKLNYKFDIDFSNHEIGKYFNNCSKMNINDKEIKFYCNFPTNMIVDFFEKNESIYLGYNGKVENWKLHNDDSIKNQFKMWLTPSSVLEERIKQISYNLEDFNVVHFRLGDKFIVENKNSFFDSVLFYITYQKLESILNKIKDTNFFLISDSVEFKNYVRTKNKNSKLFISNGFPQHFGVSNNLLDTLAEYVICTKSKKIFSHSCYGWLSGFVHSIHKIYDIEITQF